ncbi:MAG: transposase [Clostridia bacterium]|nr:transposase [Clostridia bacterium]
MFRGINKQKIFNELYDYKKALDLLIDCRNRNDFQLFAYCFMPNHIHILMKEGSKPIGTALKSFGIRYATWYNAKYSRVGHLFQDRFKSESVEDEVYFCTVLRYILQNPVKAGLVSDVKDYQFSSYSDFFGNGEIVDRAFSLSLHDINSWDEFIRIDESTKCLDITENIPIRLTQEQAMTVFQNIAMCESPADFQNYDIQKQQKITVMLKDNGLSVRQIASLTGLSCYAVLQHEKASSNREPSPV